LVDSFDDTRSQHSVTMKIRSLRLSLLLLLVATAGARAQMPPAQAGAQASGDALLAGDFQRFADLVYPPLVAESGGRDSMIARVRNGLAGAAENGMVMTSITTGSPTRYDTLGSRVYAVIPTETIMRVPGGRYVVDATMLGISDSGGPWTYVDPGDTPEQSMALLFPEDKELVTRLALAPRSTPRFEKDEK
jgi:hypothetical protein